MRDGVHTLRKQLRLALLLLLLVASSAHALPYRQSGLRSGGEHTGGNLAVGEEERGHSERDSSPPRPSDELISNMKMHNEAFNYQYAFWNETELDEGSCSQLAQQLNNETARSADGETACIPHYTCDRDPFRYPQWLVFTTCTMGTGRGCDPEHPDSSLGYRCFPREEDVLMLRYVTERPTRSGRRTDGAAETGSEGEKPAERGKGEWQLWFVQVPSECRCYL